MLKWVICIGVRPTDVLEVASQVPCSLVTRKSWPVIPGVLIPDETAISNIICTDQPATPVCHLIAWNHFIKASEGRKGKSNENQCKAENSRNYNVSCNE